MTNLTPEQRDQLEQEIRNLQCDLQATVAKATGDYQMIRFIDKLLTSDKFWELFGDLDLPKTREEITVIANARQAKRNRIKEIEELLKQGN